MILLYGWADDRPLQLVAERLTERGEPFVFVDQAVLGHATVHLTLDDRGVHGTVRLPGQWFEIDEISAVYNRPLGLPRLDPATLRRAERNHLALLAWLDVTEARVVNRLDPAHSNNSKPLQAQLIGEHGFDVPTTLVTNDPDEVRRFVAECGTVIYKSTSGVRSIVQRLGELSSVGETLERVRHLPTQFQAHVPGTDVRVHVVGERAFPVEIVTDGDDYRYAGARGGSSTLSAIEIPPRIAAACVELAAALGLPLAGIDLRRRPDGGWVCFEVNPMPAFSWFESASGAPISAAVAELLLAA